MTELVAFFVRTPRGKVHCAMKDPTGQLYSWKDCRVGTEFETITMFELSDVDPEAMCSWCIRPLYGYFSY